MNQRGNWHGTTPLLGSQTVGASTNAPKGTSSLYPGKKSSDTKRHCHRRARLRHRGYAYQLSAARLALRSRSTAEGAAHTGEVRGMADIRVETVQLDAAGNRQIASRTRTTSALGERATEIEEAIVQASVIAQQSLDQVPQRDGWQVRSLDVTFGLTLAAEAGVILSKASAEASFEVTLTVERTPGTP